MRGAAFVFGALCLLLAGCSQGSAPPPPPTDASVTERETVKIYDHDGNLFLRLKADKKGYKIFDGEETLLARLKESQDHIKVENDKRPLLRLKRSGKKYKSWVGENESKEIQFTFSERDDKGYELANGFGDLLYTVIRKGDGFEVLDDHGKTLYTLSIVKERVVITRADGFKMYEVHGSTSMVACSPLCLDKFNVTSRAALFAFLHQLENGDIAQGI